MTKKKKSIPKEEICEDCCFFCKDGGDVRVCDYRDCLKVYHPQCVGKDDSFLETEDRWNCNWHSCLICKKYAKFHCLCCPRAVCGCCLSDTAFVIVRGTRGLCNMCLQLAKLIEEKKDVDSDGGRIDFEDRSTYEYLFKEYWEIVKEKEGLTSKHVQSAVDLLRKNKNYGSNEEEKDVSDIEMGSYPYTLVSDSDNLSDMSYFYSIRKRKKSTKKANLRKRQVNTSEEFLGWASKRLVEFLIFIGRNPAEYISQHEVAAIVIRYCEENKLFHPQKKKKILCDSRLCSLLGRKLLNKNQIYGLLEVHFAENQAQSEEWDEEEEPAFGYTSDYSDDGEKLDRKKQRNLSPEKRSQEEVLTDVQLNSPAPITFQNIKVIYLKRSLVLDLLKQPECFEEKVVGSLVKVKSDPNDITQKNSHQLVQVTGIKKFSGEINTEILLQISIYYMEKDISISKLSEEDFSEEESQDLCQRMKDGPLKWPTFVELQQKARSLHADITKHWIARELVRLQILMDRANEKGWRRKYQQYWERKMLLQTPSEQERLLNTDPKVIADIIEPETADENSCRNNEEDNHDFSGTIHRSTTAIPGKKPKKSKTTCVMERGMTFRDSSHRSTLTTLGRNLKEFEASCMVKKTAISDSGQRSTSTTPGMNLKEVETSSLVERRMDIPDFSNKPIFTTPSKKLKESEASCVVERRIDVPHSGHGSTSAASGMNLKEAEAYSMVERMDDAAGKQYHSDCTIRTGAQGLTEKSKGVEAIEFIDLTDDGEDTKTAVRDTPINKNRSLWYVAPRGPYPMHVIKQWHKSSDFRG